MLTIINLILTALIIYFSKSAILLLSIFSLSFVNAIVYKVPLHSLLKRCVSVSIINILILIGYSLSYGSGEVVNYIGIKIYISGYYSGIELVTRIILLAFYVFSVNISKRKDYVLEEVYKYFEKVSTVKRIFSILINAVYLTEIFFIKVTSKGTKYSILKAGRLIKDILLTIDEHDSGSQILKGSASEKKPVFEKIVFGITLVIFTLGFVFKIYYK